MTASFAFRYARPLSLLLFLALFAGCAASKQEVRQFQEDHSEFRARMVKMDSRLERIESDIEALYDLLGDDVNANLRAMRADQSASNQELEDRFLSLTARMEDNERRLTRLMDDLQAIQASLREAVPAANGEVQGESRALYDQSQAELTRGEYELARSGFRQLLALDPGSPLADDALYGIGESFMAEQEADSARSYFEAVETRFPDSNRLPVTLLKRGILAENDGDSDTARTLFRRIIAEYPASQEAEQAELRLSNR